MYVVVGLKHNGISEPVHGLKVDKIAANRLRDETIETGKYIQVFIRQYYKDRHGRNTFRVLHKNTWTKDT